MRKQITLFLTLFTVSLGCVLQMEAQSKRRPHGKPKLTAITTAVPIGDWGGADIHLSVKEAVTEIEFSCADGSIPGRLKTDKNGGFRAPGTYTERSHGPVRIDSEPKPVKITYLGKVKGNTMILTMDFPNTHKSDLNFSLRKGAIDDRFVRCY
jgi:hypothetical protein